MVLTESERDNTVYEIKHGDEHLIVFYLTQSDSDNNTAYEIKH